MRSLHYHAYGGIEVQQLGDQPVPEIADDEVLIRVRSASLNPFDWKLRSGLLRDVFDLAFPLTPGRDGCGEIVRLGSDAGGPGLAEGRRVNFISSRLRQGALAEFAAVKARDFVVPAAENLDDGESAALALCGLSAWNALMDTAAVAAGMRVLVHGGSGGVGSIAIQIAVHAGAEVYATCHSANKDRVESLGAHALPYDQLDFSAAVTDCDIVFDTVGGQVHENSYRVLKKGGCIVYLLARPFTDRAAEFGVDVRQVKVLGHTGNLRKVIDFAGKGILKPVIGRTFRIEDHARAFEIAEAGKAGGKVVVSIGAQAIRG